MPRHATRVGISGLIGEIIEVAISVLVLSLMLLGIGGVVFKALKPGGWIEGLGVGFWRVHPALLVIAVVAIPIVTMLGKRWLDNTPVVESKGDLLAFAALALGIYFGLRLMFLGTI